MIRSSRLSFLQEHGLQDGPSFRPELIVEVVDGCLIRGAVLNGLLQ